MTTFPRLTLARALVAALVAVLASLALVAATPVTASAKPQVGFGEQHPSMFFDARFAWLQQTGQNRIGRFVVPWDWERHKDLRRETKQWMERALSYGVEPFVQFGRSYERRLRYDTPSPKAFRKIFLRFRKKYPQVTTFNPWNEANHCSQPTCRKPKLVAQYYNQMRSACRSCKIVAADVIDQKDFVGWLRTFKRFAKGKPRLWGVHNYLDTNYLRTSGTRKILRTLPGEIWFTEVGGIVKRDIAKKEPFNEGINHQSRATKWVLKRLVKLSPRIKRVYFYHFLVTNKRNYWDSAVIDIKGRARPAFSVVARYLGLDPRKAPGKFLRRP